ncbi:PKD domain-containing protein [Lewinella sp. IMCC34191]|uniref:PKD domain-containing protein n=1 Tax=Lewinella sp. IMCC34191 TaxID=2259172 RepID=UPI000E227A99|nr:PKD domain-containing protein [Lewinella sp. IMCC34191]
MKTLFLAALVCCSLTLIAQNTYHEPLEIKAGFIRLPAMGEVAVGDALFVYQYGGATTENSGSQAGRILDMNGAGHYDLTRVSRIAGDTVFISPGLLHAYDIAFTQVVADAGLAERTVGNLSASAYDGSVGGVLFVSATGQLTLNGTLDASGSGFRGGAGIQKPGDCNFLSPSDGYTYAEGSFEGTRRGEGVTSIPSGRELGRAPSANGGGGGNDHNSGGGGGANAALGGPGGENITNSPFRCSGQYPGLGGYALPDDTERLYFGGGGGAGHANNTSNAGGGNGGGIVVLWAPTIKVGANARILAAGSAGRSVDGDGAGGGGAAGSVLLIADQLNGSPIIDLRGGSGGDTNNQSDRCFGPGGGGAGGRLLVPAGLNLDVSAIDASGGPAGVRTGSAICDATDGPAGAGMDGGMQERKLKRPVGGFALDKQTVCPGQTLVVTDQSNGADRVAWTIMPDVTGLGLTETTNGLSIAVNGAAPGAYTLTQLLYLDGEEYVGQTGSFTIAAAAMADSVSLVMVGDSVGVTLVNPRAYDAIRYDFGDGTILTTDEAKAGHRYATVDDYTVEVTLVNGACGDVVIPAGVVRPGETTRAFILEKDPTGCPPLVITPFDLSQGSYSARRWDFPGGTPESSTEEKPVVTYDRPGVYTATLTLLGNTVGDDTSTTIQVVVFDAPVAAFDYSIADGRLTLTNQSVDAISSYWTFGDGNSSTESDPVHRYAKDSNYTVMLVATGPSCTDTLRQEINMTGTTSVGELAAIGVTVYPNPTTGWVTVSGPATIAAVYDGRGRRVFDSTDHVDLSPFPAGVYFLQLLTEKGPKRLRILKQ